MNLNIKPTQSFRGDYRGSVYIRVFIDVITPTCISITVLKKNGTPLHSCTPFSPPPRHSNGRSWGAQLFYREAQAARVCNSKKSRPVKPKGTGPRFHRAPRWPYFLASHPPVPASPPSRNPRPHRLRRFCLVPPPPSPLPLVRLLARSLTLDRSPRPDSSVRWIGLVFDLQVRSCTSRVPVASRTNQPWRLVSFIFFHVFFSRCWFRASKLSSFANGVGDGLILRC
jgi:hypothetical protein